MGCIDSKPIDQQENVPDPDSQLEQVGKYKLRRLREITDNFSAQNIIGTPGGFGEVYKGTLTDRRFLAVKKLSNNQSIDDATQFKENVENLTKLKHRNIVKLDGCCAVIRPRKERYLCYEYLSNGSLHDELSDQTRGFHWDKHFEIIKGISSGLCYLHEQTQNDPDGPDPNYIHLDLKPRNILLDSKMVPKIAELGLSSLFGRGQTRTITTELVESRRYMAPECLRQGQISKAADVFSFGMIILKVMTGKSMAVAPDQDSPDSLIEQYTTEVRQNWSTSDQIKSRYPSLEREPHRLKEVTGCIGIGLQCAEINPVRRPTAGQIVDMLRQLPQLKDGQNFFIDESSRMIGYRLSGTALKWEMAPSPEAPSSSSRFTQGPVCLGSNKVHIIGEIPTRDLYKDTAYHVYLVYRSSTSSVKEDHESSIKLLPSGKNITTSRVRLLDYTPRQRHADRGDVTRPVQREYDGRMGMELKLGEFENRNEVQNEDVVTVIAGVYDVDTTLAKSLIIEGMEFRPRPRS